MSAEQNAVEGLSEGEQSALFQSMIGWARDLCLTTDSPFEVVERIVADRVRLAVDEFAAEVERRLRVHQRQAAVHKAAFQPMYALGMDNAARIVRELREQGGES